ncbi:hypothetical protein R3P38DRAFT_3225403 [Favolaschia claudopus]|uniref:Uncharacterized protein n=1 Tax=Favolaschia claudopus TaxID=2862362 RepID=A0AAV9ZUV3_9AGAR
MDQFFDYQSGDGAGLPSWKSQPYFEFDRGRYTSHGSIKKGNKHTKILQEQVCLQETSGRRLREGMAESMCVPTCASALTSPNALWPVHDALAGSAIGMIYDGAEQLYDEVRNAGKNMLDDALEVILFQPRHNTFFHRRLVSCPSHSGCLRHRRSPCKAALTDIYTQIEIHTDQDYLVPTSTYTTAAAPLYRLEVEGHSSLTKPTSSSLRIRHFVHQRHVTVVPAPTQCRQIVACDPFDHRHFPLSFPFYSRHLHSTPSTPFETRKQARDVPRSHSSDPRRRPDCCHSDVLQHAHILQVIGTIPEIPGFAGDVKDEGSF